MLLEEKKHFERSITLKFNPELSETEQKVIQNDSIYLNIKKGIFKITILVKHFAISKYRRDWTYPV